MEKSNSNLIIGLGGIFFKSQDPNGLSKWYKEKLGLYSRFEADKDEPLTTFEWKTKDDKPQHTVFGLFEKGTSYFEPSEQPFMFNFIVEKLDEAISKLKERGIENIAPIKTFPYGRLTHIIDPEGNKIELWEPNDLANA